MTDYTSIGPEFWADRCKRMEGYHRVMNAGIPPSEWAGVTGRQITTLRALPLDWTRIEGGVVASESQMTVLDVGCGIGRHIAHTRMMAAKVYGLDYCDAMLDVARRNFQGLDNVRFLKGDLRKPAGLPIGKVDLAMQWSVLCHLVTEDDFAAAIKCLKMWASKYVLYADKCSGEVDVPYVRVWPAGDVIEAMKPMELVAHLKHVDANAALTEVYDTFDVMLFRTKQAAREEQDRAGLPLPKAEQAVVEEPLAVVEPTVPPVVESMIPMVDAAPDESKPVMGEVKRGPRSYGKS